MAFRRHIADFKQQFGPYGIRIANQAEQDRRLKASLAEVFTDSIPALRTCVEQLEVMDTLFCSGLRPAGDQYLLHDLKLRYGKLRLESLTKEKAVQSPSLREHAKPA
jgi:hypothetical protein